MTLPPFLEKNLHSIMNNIFLNNDPLLYQGKYPEPAPMPLPLEYYKMPVAHDYLGELDKELKQLDANVIENLNSNPRFQQLNQQLQQMVQEELLGMVRGKLNNIPLVVENIKSQMNIITDTKNQTKEIERQSMFELNDYMQNYSHLTFDEYRRIKNGEEIVVENKQPKKK